MDLYRKYSNLFNFVSIITLIILSEAIAQSCIKKYNLDKNVYYFFGGCLFYLCVVMLLCKSYNYDGMYDVNLYWSIGSIVTVLAFDIILFHAVIKTEDIFGIFLCLLGIYFIFIYGHNQKVKLE